MLFELLVFSIVETKSFVFKLEKVFGFVGNSIYVLEGSNFYACRLFVEF